VDFAFSPEQEQLRDSVRSWLEKRAPRTYMRQMLEDPAGSTPEIWQELADLGWLGLLVPEEHGGLGLQMVDLVVVQEEVGRAIFPGPFFSSAVLATLAARSLGLPELLSGLASGRARGTVALEEAGHGDPLQAVRARARRSGAPGSSVSILSGEKPLVLDGEGASWAIVVARDESGIGSYLLENPDGQAVEVLDVTRRAARLILDGREAVRVGPPGDQSALWRGILLDAGVAIAAELVGVMENALSLAVDYARTRVQFGRPIATFQVIKHKAADMLHRLELARVGVDYAAWAAGAGDIERERAAAMVKAYAGQAAVFVTGEAIQIHGGVGFTWDVDAHLLFRRAKFDDVLFGAGGWQRSRLAELLVGEGGSLLSGPDR